MTAQVINLARPAPSAGAQPTVRQMLEACPEVRVTITAGHSKVYAARLDGVIVKESDNLTPVARVADALRVLIRHGAKIPHLKG